MNPHDCCYTCGAVGGQGKFRLAKEIEDQLPPLPKNWVQPTQKVVMHWTELDWRYYIYIYYRWVEMVDAEIGRLYGGLKDSRFADNTVVVFAADHGDGLGFHGNISKGYMEEEAWRVPTIIVDPGKASRGRRDEEHLSIGVDISATICDYAEVPMLPKMTHGRSLRPLVQGRKDVPWRDHIVGESVCGQQVGVRDERYKTIFYCKGDAEKVFDLKADPLEMNDLAATPNGKSVRARHRKYFLDYLEKIEPYDPGGGADPRNKVYFDYYNTMRKEA